MGEAKIIRKRTGGLSPKQAKARGRAIKKAVTQVAAAKPSQPIAKVIRKHTGGITPQEAKARGQALKKAAQAAATAAKIKPRGQAVQAVATAAGKPKVPSAKTMVNVALSNLDERKGSSFFAIKKYIHTIYKVDLGKWAGHIKRYLKSAVENKIVVQTKGNGISGRFKLAKVETAKKSPMKKPIHKEAKKPVTEAAGKVSKGAKKKAKAGKKPVETKKSAATKTASTGNSAAVKKMKSKTKISKTKGIKRRHMA